EARGHYEEAQKNSFDGAKILGEAMEGITGDHAQVPQHVFSFGQMCQENVQKTKEGKEITPIPSRDLFRLFRDLVFIV
ncbi:MAG: hypothetical protein KAR35_09225, partial [Candidatus Heimdallarchaeota archaeon]|nr:hypothetical protein [Candidatus Heimdallarchaeota archaeon]MCK5049536.1 hypothetical protein [Candidatus Heimdallarchaeota archaeon]